MKLILALILTVTAINATAGTESVYLLKTLSNSHCNITLAQSQLELRDLKWRISQPQYADQQKFFEAKIESAEQKVIQNTELCNQSILALKEAEHQQALLEEEQAKQIAAKEAAERERKARPSARLGMSAKTVIEKTSWGKPDEIRTTTTRYGVHEQWIYRITAYHNNYLYFDNGILTGAQN